MECSVKGLPAVDLVGHYYHTETTGSDVSSAGVLERNGRQLSKEWNVQ